MSTNPFDAANARVRASDDRIGPVIWGATFHYEVDGKALRPEVWACVFARNHRILAHVCGQNLDAVADKAIAEARRYLDEPPSPPSVTDETPGDPTAVVAEALS